MRFQRELLALLLFGIAFGYVEAAVVVYLRTIDEPARRHARPDRTADDVFPLPRLEDWKQGGQQLAERLGATEAWRELATMVMLAAVGLAHARNMRQWFAGFMVSFGMWDLFYYVFLKLLIGWPASPWTWDILFGLPVVWSGPVIAPCLVAAEMVLGGAMILWREHGARPIALGGGHWLAIVAGGLIVITAFCWDHKNVTTGGMPNPFPWPGFLAGNLLSIAGFLHAARGAERRPVRQALA
jgi:hypothetical protein